MTNRINPAQISGTPATNSLADSIGPYRFRGGPGCQGVRVSATSSNTSDACTIFFTEPGVALGTNSAEDPQVSNLGTLTCPFSIVLDTNQMGGSCDIYVQGSTLTGTLVINIQKVVQ